MNQQRATLDRIIYNNQQRIYQSPEDPRVWFSFANQLQQIRMWRFQFRARVIGNHLSGLLMDKTSAGTQDDLKTERDAPFQDNPSQENEEKSVPSQNVVGDEHGLESSNESNLNDSKRMSVDQVRLSPKIDQISPPKIDRVQEIPKSTNFTQTLVTQVANVSTQTDSLLSPYEKQLYEFQINQLNSKIRAKETEVLSLLQGMHSLKEEISDLTRRKNG